MGVRKPDHFLNSAAGSGGAAHTIGNLIIGVDRLLAEVQPEAMHDITNIGDDEIIVMQWANEVFDRARPDTYACAL